MTNEQRRTNKKDCSDRLLWCVKMKMVLSEDNLLLLKTVHDVLKVIGGFARRLRLSLVYTFKHTSVTQVFYSHSQID